jgi:rhodanese-related sulfurtransferase
MLSSPEQGQPLILYVSVTHLAVSGALVVEKETTHKDKIAKQQFPVYFVSDVLAGSKKFYSKIEIFCYAVILSARKLWHYFEAHTIKVLTNQPLNDFKKRSAIKSQVLVDFVAEWMVPGSAADSEVPETPWVVYCNGAWSAIGARAVAILISPLGIKLRYAARMQFNSEVDKCTNNIAEYEAILLGLCKLRAIGI